MKVSRGLFRRSGIVALMAVALLGAARTASAANCMQDFYRAAGGKGKLNCTANDVRVARVTNITNVKGITGTSPNLSCLVGTPIEFTADFEIELGAVGGARYDIGIYLANGQSQALTGTCNASIITPENALRFDQEDTIAQPADICGDISGSTGTNPQIVRMDVKTTCTAGSDGKLLLPNCTSWRQPGANESCTGIADAFPGTSSKCKCDHNFSVNVAVERPVLQVTKTPSRLQVPWPGGEVTYTVSVHNPSATISIPLTRLTEDETNDGVVDRKYEATSTPTLASVCRDTVLAPCGPDPNNCNPASTTTCSFTGYVSGNRGDAVTDKACVYGRIGDREEGFCGTASASVQDEAPTAVVIKSAKQALCTTVRYEVRVVNTDPARPLTLTSLVDNLFGDVTRDKNSKSNTNRLIDRTDCTVPRTIPVALPDEPWTGQYVCTFDALVCRYPHSNVVTGSLTDGTTTITETGSATVFGVNLILDDIVLPPPQ